MSLRFALFDLDNTLYPKSCGLMGAIGHRINLFMMERLGIHPDEVTRKRDSYFRSHGTTLNALRRFYPVDPDEYLDFVHDLPLEQHLQYDPELDRMLDALNLRKIIFTNADAKHARRVLSRLRLLHHFESVIDIHTLDFINKPDRRAYIRALDFASARPEECILIEDSMVNIVPARELGMTTVLVGTKPAMDGAHYHIERVADLAGIVKTI
jgi:putative hydrolase of the HAD superfamily